MKHLFYLVLTIVLATGNLYASDFDGVGKSKKIAFENILTTKSAPNLSAQITADLSFVPSKNKIARTHWLPDYQDATKTRVSSAGNDSSKETKTCATYGLLDTCDGNKVGTKKYQPDGSVCYDNCKCPAKFKYTDSTCKLDPVYGIGYKAGSNLCDSKADSCKPQGCSSGSIIKPTCASGYETESLGLSGASICYANDCKKSICPSTTKTNSSCAAGLKAVATSYKSGSDTCYRCEAQSCSEKCVGFSSGLTCAKGMIAENCGSDCSDFIKCTGTSCPKNLACSEYDCKTYSKQSGCSDVCIECKTCSPTCPIGYQSIDCNAADGAKITPVSDSCKNANACHKCSIKTCKDAGFNLIEEQKKPTPQVGRTPKYYDQSGNLISASLMQMKNITLVGRMIEIMSVNSAYAAFDLNKDQVMPSLCPSYCKPGDCYDLYHARSECCPCELKADIICGDGYKKIAGRCVEDQLVKPDLPMCIVGYEKNPITGKCDKVCTIKDTVMVGEVCLPTTQEFEFKVSETCPHDNRYVKGQWVEKPLTCQSFGTIEAGVGIALMEAHTAGGLTNCAQKFNSVCDTIVEVTVPANATCTGINIYCPGKCASWVCKDGYDKIGETCQPNKINKPIELNISIVVGVAVDGSVYNDGSFFDKLNMSSINAIASASLKNKTTNKTDCININDESLRCGGELINVNKSCGKLSCSYNFKIPNNGSSIETDSMYGGLWDNCSSMIATDDTGKEVATGETATLYPTKNTTYSYTFYCNGNSW